MRHRRAFNWELIICFELELPCNIVVRTSSSFNSDTIQQVEVGQLLNDEDVRTTILQGSSSSKQIINSQLNARRWRMVEPVYSSGDSQAVIGAIVMESNIESIYEQITDITLIFLRASLIAILL